MQISGRTEEQSTLQRTLESREAEFVAVYGRRRIGKTFLIRTFYAEYLRFELTGEYKASVQAQLENFAFALTRAQGLADPIPTPSSWKKAFQLLVSYLESLDKNQKHVLFFDELPWLASPRSQFLSGLEYFWNSWCVKFPNVVLVVCGSAASWMIQKVIRNRGGLHNRVTQRIRLQPFTLAETKGYLEQRGVSLSNFQILQLYMAMGGIPHYLKEIRPGLSAAQNIEAICFSATGLLRDEFPLIFSSLFNHSQRHEKVIRALAGCRQGMSRDEIQNQTKIESGGTLSATLTELMESGFIAAIIPGYQPRQTTLYRLVDEYSLFYIRWIEGGGTAGKNSWIKNQTSPAWKAWSGYTFETICFKHIGSLKKALGIEAVETREYSWLYRPHDNGEKGAQIDLVIDRRDDCINLCEIKYTSSEFTIDKSYAANLRHKKESFRQWTETKKSLFVTLISTFGVKNNQYHTEIVDQSLDADIFFVNA